ncbi:MAG: FMN-binding protein [Treponema sp.]|jgi:uncharacterized protein with FMN-binding domain|nr:FMN-binding protein [Treponema sp.]
MNILRKYGGLLILLVLVLPGCPNPSDSGGGGGGPSVLGGAVFVNGSATLGATLTADISALEGAGTVSYQWLRDNSVAITGAVLETYSPAASDFNKLLRVRVSREGYTGTVESDSVGPVSTKSDDISWNVNGTTKYFSLSQGIEIPAAKSNTAEWDVAVKSDGYFCYILTNSGVTASSLGSGGKGGVWFTNKTDFNSVVFADRVADFTGGNAEYAPYVTDVTRSQYGMFGTYGGPMNIMTYFGYASGDGLSESTQFYWSFPGPPSGPFYEFDKKAFAAVTGGMPPPWYPTRQVYIIRHADGTSYSKFQVFALKYQSGTFALSFKFKAKNPLRFTPGTYDGQVAGFGGPLDISTTFSADAITNIVINSHSETPSIGTIALADIPPAIIAAQRLDVDVVSGATVTSKAILQAVADSIVKAGGNPDDLKGTP